MTKTPCKSARDYHHGNLRNALIMAAAELIEERGCADFAMADAARKAGVSSAAPYRHFKDKDALLEAVIELAFLALAEASRVVYDDSEHGSDLSLILLGRAYIGFVISHPKFYDLMWGAHGMHAFASDEARLKTSGFYVLVEAVEDWCRAQKVTGRSAVELAIKLWSIAHGLSGLSMNHHVDRFLPGADTGELFESTILVFLNGLRSMAAKS